MDHSEATERGAVERYVLGDLTVSEVEEFERHFFDCPQCSEELRMMAVFQDNARAVFIEQGPTPSRVVAAVEKPPRVSWWTRLGPWVAVPAMAALAIGIFAGYEAGMRNPAGSPQEISPYPLYAASRGEETVIAPPAGAQFYELYMDRTWDTEFASYRAVVRGDSPNGPERWSIKLAAPAPGKAIHILTPVRALGSGRYVMTIYGIGGDGREVETGRYPFTLRIE
jgi:hypothetical protein